MKRKETARAYQARPQTITIHLTAAEVRVLSIIRDEWCSSKASLSVAARVLINLAMVHWHQVRPAFDADAAYMEAEGFRDCWPIWQPKIAKAYAVTYSNPRGDE